MATVYLDPAGDDSRTYVQAQNPATPWETLGKVEASATTGDTVSMAEGTFPGETITWSKNFNLVGGPIVDGLPTTIIDDASGDFQWLLTGRTFSLERIYFDNLAPTDGRFRFGGGVAGWTIVNCFFKVVGGSTWAIFTNQGGVITASYTGCGWYIDHTGSGQIFMLYDPAASMTLTLHNNTIYIEQAPSGMIIVYLYTANAHLVAKNNIVQNASAVSVKFTHDAGSAPTPTIEHNCFNGTITFDVGTSVDGITSDPLFVDPDNLNFSLRPDSPCIDAGTLI